MPVSDRPCPYCAGELTLHTGPNESPTVTCAGVVVYFPGVSRGQEKSAYPQVRGAGLAECGTHAVFTAEAVPLAVHETELAQRLFSSLAPGMLLLADRGFRGFDLWRARRRNRRRPAVAGQE
ncbi:hypothetical protein [Streptomyces sp. 35G-GA-8]|uniref:hypothetical protein n=1 Tax=Streptomyces sp. 35G-GA-8 TaxID=2939434 RepID=UPI00201F7C84|nr:hypothetical protein [Streptomyces sp. 35G-GA-8]MCL7380893.1 hypothetical protein [Streptomyces sp. 35G-GA-8]